MATRFSNDSIYRAPFGDENVTVFTYILPNLCAFTNRKIGLCPEKEK
ncbi:hypothetical protein GBL_2034 [Geobacillus kaustophilus GBlys]|uniref:Uncharacterized protein n=1 Tax=Geobacillus kaustophilus GBlys TaxID=1337888 RepID=U2X528_GEOKU|nr:hypothetical protein GBL_2034 [Geobacillus kaustophilus GBlys]